MLCGRSPMPEKENPCPADRLAGRPHSGRIADAAASESVSPRLRTGAGRSGTAPVAPPTAITLTITTAAACALPKTLFAGSVPGARLAVTLALAVEIAAVCLSVARSVTAARPSVCQDEARRLSRGRLAAVFVHCPYRRAGGDKSRQCNTHDPVRHVSHHVLSMCSDPRGAR